MCRKAGGRCCECYRLRMEEAARLAEQGRAATLATTTLSISPLKNAGKINEIGQRAVPNFTRWNICLLILKKKNGYKRSIELSHEYGLYRQNYCGCVFSKRESMEKQRQREEEEKCECGSKMQ